MPNTHTAPTPREALAPHDAAVLAAVTRLTFIGVDMDVSAIAAQCDMSRSSTYVAMLRLADAGLIIWPPGQRGSRRRVSIAIRSAFTPVPLIPKDAHAY